MNPITACPRPRSQRVGRHRGCPWRTRSTFGIYPLESMVKVDDTLPGIEEGINAGMWTVGLAKSGNEIGLTRE